MMNNLDKIIQKINEDADRKIAEIEADRDLEIDALNKRTEELLSSMHAENEVRAQKETNAILSRANAAASMKSREILLRTKSALMEEVYHRAEETIYALPDDEYTAFLVKLTTDAVVDRIQTVQNLKELYGEEEADDDEISAFSVVLSSADKEKYGKTVLDLSQTILNTRVKNAPVLTLAAKTAQIPGGVIIRYGDMETCCSIPALLANIREKTDNTIAAMLFG